MSSEITFLEVCEGIQIAQVESLAREIWPEHYVPIIGLPQVDYMLARFQTFAAIEAQINEGQRYFLVTSGQERVGYLAVAADRDKRELILSKIYVRSSYRGQGFGKKMMGFVEELAKSMKFTRVALAVNKKNNSSVRFYEHCGFKKLGTIVKDIGNGFVMDDFLYVKTLS
ncbi:MAG: GNAT family N-acetyltransferase [Candidatus Omnitrophica bacterium]|nr:GNAT family N-acetyltransferase [Candidatus Omnitrophota bacterium]